jgi:hypothetical protein
MKKESVKESLLSYMYKGGKISKLYENGGTGEKGPKADPLEPVEPAEEKNDPDKNAENPELTDIMGSHNSILFLTAPDKTGIIKRGGNMGFIELTPDIVKESGMEIDLEDFQWYCPAEEFEAYLKSTGRKYNKNSGDWTSESEETKEKERKISTYSDFLNEKEKLGPLNEFGGVPFLGNVGTNVTGKGLEYEGDDPDFKKGKLTEDQKKLVRFLFTRNHLRNKGEMEKELDLTKLKQGDVKVIFVAALDPETGKYDDKSMVAITFEVDAVILAQGDIGVPMVAGKITQIAPNLGAEDGGFTGVLDAVVQTVASVWDKLNGVLETATGQILAGIAAYGAVSSIWGGLGLGAVAVFHFSRRAAKINAYISSGNKLYQGVKGYARASKLVRSTGFAARTGRYLKNTKIGKFVRYPLTVLKNYKNWKKIKNANSALRGWKAVRYIAFGKQLRALGKTASLVARGSRIVGGVAKWSNPVGWVLLAVDAVGSAMNYTSDNQAPSWDPIIGGEGDAMVAYAVEGGLCPNASNSFTPADIKIGETITLCWTQNPESGFAVALSFVASNSTRTTMNITKINDFEKGGLSMFLVNSVNYKGIWDEIKGFDLRFLFIKNATYSEGYSDDNIGTYFLGAKSNPDSKDGVLPISYYGHTDFVTFANTAAKMGDQLVIVEKDAPKTFYFHFEDSESNIINVTGSKITDEDLENASEEEVRSFFTVEPTSSYIGNPDEETEEERAERESLEASARSSSGPSDGKEEENPDSPEKVELASNENYKWYSSIEESKPITSFSEFKSIKESLLFEDDKKPPIEGGTPKEGVEELPTEVGGKEEKTPELGDIKGTTLGSQIMTAKEMGENFEKALNTIDEPIPFCIYFVENREYADPELRDIYQPGSFMNFSLLPDVMNAPDGEDIEGGIQVNNLDVLLDVKKGLYNFSEKDRETKLKDTDIEVAGGGDSKATNTILTADISSARNKESVTPLGRGGKEEIKTTLQRVKPDELNQLEISDWEDVTSIKIIRDGSGNPERIKIKNRKAGFGDKSRTIEKGERGWEAALSLAKANNDREAEEQKLELAKR